MRRRRGFFARHAYGTVAAMVAVTLVALVSHQFAVLTAPADPAELRRATVQQGEQQKQQVREQREWQVAERLPW